jgi:hypothetical protein
MRLKLALVIFVIAAAAGTGFWIAQAIHSAPAFYQ